MDVILFLGCLVSLILTQRAKKTSYFYWWPMYLGYWFSLLASVEFTGGLYSPFIGVYLALLYFGGVLIQIRIPPLGIAAFTIAQVPLIFGLQAIWPFAAMPAPPAAFVIFLLCVGLAALGACIFALLQTERELADQFAARYTELISTRQELRKEEASNLAKITFLANVSHELRTPLAAIVGYSDLLVEAGPLNTEQVSYVDTVRRNSKQLRHLVDDLLDLSRVEAGHVEIQNSRFRLTDLLTDILNQTRLPAEKKNLAIAVEYKGEVPMFVAADPTRVRQIILNLVGNALKFTEKGGVTIRVDHHVDEKNGHLHIFVEDTGRGILESEQTRLFKPFSQGDPSMARRFGGTGLGLSLSRRLAVLMGGTLELMRSTPGRGSIFMLTLPVGDVAAQEWLTEFLPTVAESNAKKKMAKDRLQGVKILYVDDTADNQMLVKVYLNSVGATVDMASNGFEGIEKAMHGNYDLVLMDIQMPVMDGYEAVSRLRQDGFKTPILALTAHAMKEDWQRCHDVGCDGHLTKPISNIDLVQAIERFIKPNSSGRGDRPASSL
jgi:signal transduction histidine kinase/CheY-like chemotaxis protein